MKLRGWGRGMIWVGMVGGIAKPALCPPDNDRRCLFDPSRHTGIRRSLQVPVETKMRASVGARVGAKVRRRLRVCQLE